MERYTHVYLHSLLLWLLSFLDLALVHKKKSRCTDVQDWKHFPLSSFFHSSASGCWQMACCQPWHVAFATGLILRDGFKAVYIAPASPRVLRQIKASVYAYTYTYIYMRTCLQTALDKSHHIVEPGWPVWVCLHNRLHNQHASQEMPSLLATCPTRRPSIALPICRPHTRPKARQTQRDNCRGDCEAKGESFCGRI